MCWSVLKSATEKIGVESNQFIGMFRVTNTVPIASRCYFRREQ